MKQIDLFNDTKQIKIWNDETITLVDRGRGIFISVEISSTMRVPCVCCDVSPHQLRQSKHRRYFYITFADQDPKEICLQCLETMNLNQIECALVRSYKVAEIRAKIDKAQTEALFGDDHQRAIEYLKTSTPAAVQLRDELSKLPKIFLTKEDKDKYYKNPQNKPLRKVDWKEHYTTDDGRS